MVNLTILENDLKKYLGMEKYLEFEVVDKEYADLIIEEKPAQRLIVLIQTVTDIYAPETPYDECKYPLREFILDQCWNEITHILNPEEAQEELQSYIEKRAENEGAEK